MSHVGVQNIDQMLLRGSWFRLWLFIPLSTLLLIQSKALIIRDFHTNIVFVSIATNELSDYQYTGHCFLEPIFFQALKIKLTEYVSRGYILPSFILIQFLLLIFQIFCYVLPLFPVCWPLGKPGLCDNYLNLSNNWTISNCMIFLCGRVRSYSAITVTGATLTKLTNRITGE